MEPTPWSVQLYSITWQPETDLIRYQKLVFAPVSRIQLDLDLLISNFVGAQLSSLKSLILNQCSNTPLILVGDTSEECGRVQHQMVSL